MKMKETIEKLETSLNKVKEVSEQASAPDEDDPWKQKD